jgi:hypothetical protein
MGVPLWASLKRRANSRSASRRFPRTVTYRICPGEARRPAGCLEPQAGADDGLSIEQVLADEKLRRKNMDEIAGRYEAALAALQKPTAKVKAG